MNINNIQGINAYTANTLMTDTGSVQKNTGETTGVEPNKDSIQPRQEAFQVEITQQALALQAENTESTSEEGQVQMQAQTAQQTGQPQGVPGRLIDIVA